MSFSRIARMSRVAESAVVCRDRASIEFVSKFGARMIDRMVRGELAAKLDVWGGFIGVQCAFAARVLSDDRAKFLCGYVRHVE